MLSELTSREVAEWMAYETLEPFGEIRADLRAALICSTIFNMNRSDKTPPMKISDFMLQFKYNQGEGDEVEQVRALESVLSATSSRGSIRMYRGRAPAIKRLGKKAPKQTAKVKRLQEILHGKPR